jgi:hypothetical protein
MSLNVTEITTLDDGGDIEDVGSFDENGVFTQAYKQPVAMGSRVPQPRITSMAYKNRGSLANTAAPPPIKTVTYDDILSSLNMKVINGKLHITRNSAVENNKSNKYSNIWHGLKKVKKIEYYFIKSF